VYLDRAAEDRKRYDEQLAEFKSLYGKAYGKSAEDIEIKENPIEDEDIENILIED
jgi:hypothetical protein